jgi:hypothetical protein
MAGWEEDLSILLRALGVKQEEIKTGQPPAKGIEDGDERGERGKQGQQEQRHEFLPPRYRQEQGARAQFADKDFWKGNQGNSDKSGDGNGNGKSRDGNEAEEDEISMEDLIVMRRKVETIVSQLVLLMQRADVDPVLKEDVLIVLHALRRRATATRQAAASEIAAMEAASAMLHFCRIVLRLDDVVIEG